MNVTLLGPQRVATAARAAVRELMPDGPIATVNAGWQERESDDSELSDVLGGRMHNLALHRRWREVLDRDEEYATAERRLDDLLDELQALYVLRLQHAMAAIDAVGRRRELPAVQEEALADAISSVQALDAWHLKAVRETRGEFRAALRPGERGIIADHRAEVAAILDGCLGVVVAGGHVGVLLRTMRVFALDKIIKAPLIAWSAGAMALAERVILYHDMAPQGPGNPEVYAEGLGIYRGVLPFPHAKRRLRLSDDDHVGLMARRFAPWACLLLADGVRVDLVDDAPLPVGSRTMSPAGGITTVEAAA
jgi:hypothetical protein